MLLVSYGLAQVRTAQLAGGSCELRGQCAAQLPPAWGSFKLEWQSLLAVQCSVISRPAVFRTVAVRPGLLQCPGVA
jgi:hypothetical protein